MELRGEGLQESQEQETPDNESQEPTLAEPILMVHPDFSL